MRYVGPFCCHAACVTLVFEKDAETMRMGTFADICCPIFIFFNAHNSLYIYILHPIFRPFSQY